MNVWELIEKFIDNIFFKIDFIFCNKITHKIFWCFYTFHWYHWNLKANPADEL